MSHPAWEMIDIAMGAAERGNHHQCLERLIEVIARSLVELEISASSIDASLIMINEQLAQRSGDDDQR